MILVGGFVTDTSTSANSSGGDPWPLGLGVFDMTNLVFQDHYDPNAPNYTTPQIIKDYYQDNGMYPSWDDVGLTEVFQSSTDSTLSTPTDDDGGSSSHTGAIVGGVVGGVVALALVGVLVWWILRRRRTARYQQAQVTGGYQPGAGPEKNYNEQAALDQVKQSPGIQSPDMNGQTFGAQQPYHEVHSQDIRHEADGRVVEQRGEGAHELQS